ncbi:MAG: signal peptidase I [Planctomycetaceae bacterium]|jgi:signal peptidase I|nr:signal peptidase I [Planctomycetaceae bacterium]
MNTQNNIQVDDIHALKQHYPCCIGLFLTFLFPGSVQFFSGRYVVSIFLYLIFMSFVVTFVVFASIPGKLFWYCALTCMIIGIIYMITLFILSWKPVKKISYWKWFSFIFFLIIFNRYLLPLSLGIFVQYIAGGIIVRSSSMEPTLISQSKYSLPDIVIVNKFIYRLKKPCRGDIVGFRYKWKKSDGIYSIILCKRIVGLPGETINIDTPFILINGKRLLDPLIFKEISSGQNGYSGFCRVEELGKQGYPLPITLGPNEYFLIGDNTHDSFDSRIIGTISRNDIVGQAIRIVFPFSRIKEL